MLSSLDAALSGKGQTVIALPPFGLWVDDSPRTVTTEAFWDDLVGLGATEAAIFLDSAAAAWDLRYTPAQVERACLLAIEHDIEPVATVWPLCRKSQIDAMIEDLRVLLPLGFAALELELEHLWLESLLDRSFDSMLEAGVYLLRRAHEICDPLDIRIEITSHLGHPESGQRALVTPSVHRANMQLYSTRRDWLKRLVGWDSRLGPGRRQRDGVERFAVVDGLEDGIPKLGLGLALYDQKWPGHTRAEALDLALEAALSEARARQLAISLVMGWSSKWVIGHLRKRLGQAEVADWIRSRWARG